MGTITRAEADDNLGVAIEVIARRNDLNQPAAAAALFDIAGEIGVSLNDLTVLITESETGRRPQVHSQRGHPSLEDA